jgi:hypothetical protein
MNQSNARIIFFRVLGDDVSRFDQLNLPVQYRKQKSLLLAMRFMINCFTII